VTTDPDHKFDLALSLDDLDVAVEIARTVPENESEVKWKALGDRALTVWRFDLARESFDKAGDLSALMLLLLAIGDRAGLAALAAKAGGCSVAPVSVLYVGLTWWFGLCSGEGPEQLGVCDHAAAGRRGCVRGPAAEDAADARGGALRAHIHS
jgi:hypothetical protein